MNDINGLFLHKANKYAVSLAIALILSMGGIAMIYSGIKDDGYIDFSAFQTQGKIKSGLVGLYLVLCATIITVAVIISSSILGKSARSSLTYKKTNDGSVEVSITGVTAVSRSKIMEILSDATETGSKPRRVDGSLSRVE